MEWVIIGRTSKYTISSICFLFTAYLCLYPAEMIVSVKDGLILWYNSVLPSVFPFLIITKILIEIGAVNKIGRFLEPVMEPIFRVPGCGAFAIIMGGVSGYPIGAKITADLRENRAITRDEAQRLISFCNNPGPLFMLGAVGTSILKSASAGYLIMISNYISAIMIGFLFRFYKTESGGRDERRSVANRRIIRPGTQSFGMIMKEAVMYAVEAVVQIGGFIILFSAFIRILEISQLLAFVTETAALTACLGIDRTLLAPLTSGIFEITNGISMIGSATAPFSEKVIISGMLVSFGGLSIFAQSVGFISKTDISGKIYFFSKILHGTLQGFIVFLLYPIVVV